MNNRFKSLAGLDENATLSPTPQADPDQLICVNTINPSHTNHEKVVSMTKKIAPEIVPCVPIYGIFRQTDTQIYNVNSLFNMFSEYEDKMPVETNTITKEGTETTTSSALELVNEGSNAICNFTFKFDNDGKPVINFQYIDKDLIKYNNTAFTKHMYEAINSQHFISAMGLLIVENIFLYGLDNLARESNGCQGTFFMYYNRPLGGEGFHKDSTGNTSFVCLNYLNESVLPSATLVLSNTPEITGELVNVNDTLELIMREIHIPHCDQIQIAKTYNMGPYGTIGFNDLVVAHSSPFDKTDTSVRQIRPLVTSPGQYGHSFPSPLLSYMSSSPHPPLKEYTDVNIPRNFTRMWINFKDSSVAGDDVVAFPYENIGEDVVNAIILRCLEKKRRAQKCLSVEELCASFIDPMHNPGTGTCSASLSRNNSPATILQGIQYVPPSTTTTTNANTARLAPTYIFRPVASVPAVSSSTTTAVKDDYSELPDYDDFSDQPAYAVLPAAPVRKQMMGKAIGKQRTTNMNDDDDAVINSYMNPQELHKKKREETEDTEGLRTSKRVNSVPLPNIVDDLPDYDDTHPSNLGGSKERSLKGYNKKTKRRYNKVSKKTSHNKVTKRKGKRKRNKVTKRKERGKKTGKHNKVTKKHKRVGGKRIR